MTILPGEVVIIKVVLGWSNVFGDMARLNLTHPLEGLLGSDGKIVNMSAEIIITRFILMHQGARNSGNSLGKILVFSANFLENFYNFSGVNNNVCNLDINNYYSVSTITKPILIFTIFIFTVTLPNVLYLNSHFSKIVVSSITTLGH